VTDNPRRPIQIELSLEGAMPSGVATGPDGDARDFTGWVGLMSAVDALWALDDELPADGEV
jgi:hypothetical protein